MLNIVECPSCAVRVMPKSDGMCPSCGANINVSPPGAGETPAHATDSAQTAPSQTKPGLFQTDVGLIAAAFFIAIGAYTLAWGFQWHRIVSASKSWPTVEGPVTHAGTRRVGKELIADIQYKYEVDGKTFESERRGFAPFRKPGSSGKTEFILNRYPVGKLVTVSYDPADPSSAVLEPGDFSAFIMPCFLGGLFLPMGLFVVLSAIRPLFMNAEGFDRRTLRMISAIAISLLFYALMMAMNLETGMQEMTEKAFGRPFGLSPWAFGALLITVCYAPMPFVFFHAMRLMIRDNGQVLGRMTAASLLMYAPETEKEQFSKGVCVGGVLYFFALMAAWIAYTAYRGI